VFAFEIRKKNEKELERNKKELSVDPVSKYLVLDVSFTFDLAQCLHS
jgi:hypothetical protein